MPKPDILLVDGHAFRWQRLVELRSRQLEDWKSSQPRQLVLFDMKDDSRPPAERNATGRYREPTFLGLMAGED